LALLEAVLVKTGAASGKFNCWLTQLALWRPDPAQITQDPVIGWGGVVAGPDTPLQIPGGPIGTSGSSAWFVAPSALRLP